MASSLRRLQICSHWVAAAQRWMPWARRAEAAPMLVRGAPRRGARGLHVFVVAGEPSGDVLGAAVMKEIRRQAGAAEQVRFSGIGGEAMAREGLQEVFPMSELAVMGLVELLPHLPRLIRRLKDTARAVEDSKPDILLTIDFKSFNFRVLNALKKKGALEGLTAAHYVGPSVWAYKRDPTKTLTFLKEHLDLLLLLYPFEAPHYRNFLRPVCVGAPILELQEVKAHIPLMAKALGIIKALMPGSADLHAHILTLPSMEGEIRDLLSQQQLPANVRVSVSTASSSEERVRAMRGHTCALAVSGSVTMELVAAHVPAVIIYRANWLTAVIAKRIAAVRHVGLPNLLVGRTLLPELLFDQCTPEAMAREIVPLLSGQEGRSAAQLEGYAEVIAKCREKGGEGGEGGGAGHAIQDCCGGNPPSARLAAAERSKGGGGGGCY